MEEKIYNVLKDILFQLHTISTQNYMAASISDNEIIHHYGVRGVEAEQKWMEGFLEERGG